MPLLLPIKWFVIQTLAFFVMVAIEAGVLHYVEGISKRHSIVYMFLVNLFSFSFGWLLVTAVFYLFTKVTFQDEILSYLLLGTVSEALLKNISINPLENSLLLVMLAYFWAIFYFELKILTILQMFILPLGEKREVQELPIPHWLDRSISVLFSKDVRLIVTLFVGNFISHIVVGGLIYLAQ